jgi:hypothetical protein
MEKLHSSIILARVVKPKEKTKKERIIELQEEKLGENESESIIIRRRIRELNQQIEYHYENTYDYLKIEELKKEVKELIETENYYKNMIAEQEIKLKNLKKK